MAARPLDSSFGSVPRVRPLAGPAAKTRSKYLRRQLVALAPTAAHAVRYAGGWMFDRVLSGWDVVVMVDDLADPRPLNILGVGVVPLEKSLASKIRQPLPQAVAVDSELYASDARVRDGVLELFEQGVVDEVTMWGTRWPNDLDSRFDPTQHRLSLAAKAFKAQALTAAAAPSDAEVGRELFRTWQFHSRGREPDLLPAAR